MSSLKDQIQKDLTDSNVINKTQEPYTEIKKDFNYA
jgi:hypothetical protein